MRKEIFETADLEDLWDSYMRYWIHTIKDNNKKTSMIKKIKIIIQNLEDKQNKNIEIQHKEYSV